MKRKPPSEGVWGPRDQKDPTSREYAIQTVRALKQYLEAADIDELYQVEILHEDAYLIVDGQLDLAPMARQAALLELDDERLCREECAGLCPHCGVDLNVETCGCDTEVVDHRWAALDGLVLDD